MTLLLRDTYFVTENFSNTVFSFTNWDSWFHPNHLSSCPVWGNAWFSLKNCIGIQVHLHIPAYGFWCLWKVVFFRYRCQSFSLNHCQTHRSLFLFAFTVGRSTTSLFWHIKSVTVFFFWSKIYAKRNFPLKGIGMEGLWDLKWDPGLIK